MHNSYLRQKTSFPFPVFSRKSDRQSVSQSVSKLSVKNKKVSFLHYLIFCAFLLKTSLLHQAYEAKASKAVKQVCLLGMANIDFIFYTAWTPNPILFYSLASENDGVSSSAPSAPMGITNPLTPEVRPLPEPLVQQGIQEESRLLSYLMRNYDREVRPVINVSSKVTVLVGITLTQIFDMVRMHTV